MQTKGSSSLQLRIAGHRAEKILKDRDVYALPVDPMKLAEQSGILVQPKPEVAEGFSGMLVRSGDEYGIMYATYLHNEGFERFSVAHELGHYFLDGHAQELLIDSNVHMSKAGFVSNKRLEREADVFAVNLLMPADLFRVMISDSEVGLDGILSVANQCKTSLTATAIRFATLTDTPLGIVISRDGRVVFSCYSKALKAICDHDKPTRGEQLPRKSAASRLWADPSLVRDGSMIAQSTFAGLWSDSASDELLYEESIGLGRYGRVLTVLSGEPIDEEEEDEERRIDESWRPRFSK